MAGNWTCWPGTGQLTSFAKNGIISLVLEVGSRSPYILKVSKWTVSCRQMRKFPCINKKLGRLQTKVAGNWATHWHQIKHVNNSPLRFFHAFEQASPPPRVVCYFFFALQQPRMADEIRYLPQKQRLKPWRILSLDDRQSPLNSTERRINWLTNKMREKNNPFYWHAVMSESLDKLSTTHNLVSISCCVNTLLKVQD